MITAVGINGLMGLGILLAVLFSMGDIVESTFSETGFPFVDIFVYASGSVHGGTGLVSQFFDQPISKVLPGSTST
jgi:choline transport protein